MKRRWCSHGFWIIGLTFALRLNAQFLLCSLVFDVASCRFRGWKTPGNDSSGNSPWRGGSVLRVESCMPQAGENYSSLFSNDIQKMSIFVLIFCTGCTCPRDCHSCTIVVRPKLHRVMRQSHVRWPPRFGGQTDAHCWARHLGVGCLDVELRRKKFWQRCLFSLRWWSANLNENWPTCPKHVILIKEILYHVGCRKPCK